MKTHKIAIFITSYTAYCCDSRDQEFILNNITEWSEVSHDDFLILQKVAQLTCNFKMVEQPVSTGEFVKLTVGDYIQREKDKAILAESVKKKKIENALKNKLSKDLKDKESKLELFNKLKAELGK